MEWKQTRKFEKLVNPNSLITKVTEQIFNKEAKQSKSTNLKMSHLIIRIKQKENF